MDSEWLLPTLEEDQVAKISYRWRKAKSSGFRNPINSVFGIIPPFPAIRKGWEQHHVGQSSVHEGAKDTRLDIFWSRGAFTFLQSFSEGCTGAQRLRDIVLHSLSLSLEPHRDSAGNTLWRIGIYWNITLTWKRKHRGTEGPGFLVLFGRVNPISLDRKIQLMDCNPGFLRGSYSCRGAEAVLDRTSAPSRFPWSGGISSSSAVLKDDPCKHEPLHYSMSWKQMLIPPALTSSG